MTNQGKDDLVRIARRTLPVLAKAAAAVSARSLEKNGESGNLALLSIALHQLAVSFTTRQVHELAGLEERCPLAALLEQLDSIAQASSSILLEPDHNYSALRKLAYLRSDDNGDLPQNDDDYKLAWQAHVKSGHSTWLLEIVDQIQQQVDSLAEEEEDDFDEVDPFEAPPEYPAHINDKLYEALSRQTKCDCSAANGFSGRFCHAARLSLTPSFKPADGEYHPFDMMFSTGLEKRYPDSYRWQWIRILMPWKSKRQSRKLLSSLRDRLEAMASPSLSKESQHLMCDRANSYSRHRIPLRFQDHCLHAAEDLAQTRVEQEVVSHSGYTLKQILSGRPSFKTRACLAYIIAKSVWQYYNSRWMSQPWTYRDLVFMQKDDAGPQDRIICEPFLLTVFEESVVHATLEMRHAASASTQCRIPRDGLLHRHPIILALGIVLLEIGTGTDPAEGNTPAHDLHRWDGRQWDSATINDLFLTAAPLGEKMGSATTDRIKRKYFKAVQACFRPDLFEDCEFVPNDPEQGREERRNIIYREIVYRLRVLVEGAGWLCSWHEHRAVDVSALALQHDLEFFADEAQMKATESSNSSAQIKINRGQSVKDETDGDFMKNLPHRSMQSQGDPSRRGVLNPTDWSDNLPEALNKSNNAASGSRSLSQAEENSLERGSPSTFYYINSYSRYEADKVNVQHVRKNNGVVAGSSRKINFDKHAHDEKRSDGLSSASSNAS